MVRFQKKWGILINHLKNFNSFIAAVESNRHDVAPMLRKDVGDELEKKKSYGWPSLRSKYTGL